MIKVEICKTTEKNANFFVEVNLDAGYEVLVGKLYEKNPTEFYYIELDNSQPVRNGEFKSIPSGLYVFKD